MGTSPTAATLPGLDRADVDRLRTALDRAGFHAATVPALLGAAAQAALERGDRVPALRATTGGTPVETFTRLFLLGRTEPAAAVASALGPLTVDAALAGGLLARDGGDLRAALDIRPYGADDDSWWVVSDLGPDLRPGAAEPDHVLGIGAASVTLAQATVRRPVAAALDLGIGCGVQALHLSRHAGAVTGTDLNPRALALAGLTAGLNGMDWELVHGDLTGPVAGRQFDLVVSNPPFVVGAGDGGITYRDSGLAGDEVCRRLVRTAPDLLADGGWCQLLANWIHLPGRPWQERLAEWIDGTGCDAWVWQREVADPAEYVGMWLRDTGERALPDAARRYDRWLDWFERAGVEAVGFGLITLRRTGADEATIRIEDVPQQVAPPVGAQIAGWFDRQHWLRRHPDDAELAAARLAAADDLVLDQTARRGPAGWAVDGQVLRQTAGMHWQAAVDPVLAALVAGCDGTNRVDELLAVLAAAYDADPVELTRAVLPAVRALVHRGLLVPVEALD